MKTDPMIIHEIARKAAARLSSLPEGTELCICDVLKDACGLDLDPIGEYRVAGTIIDFPEMFELDRMIRKTAKKAGLILDDSRYAHMVTGLPFRTPFVVFRKKK